MIELKIDGVCKECPFRSLYLNQFDDTVNCKHVMVCKFISDPHGNMPCKEKRNFDMPVQESAEERCVRLADTTLKNSASVGIRSWMKT